jgi:hypothetical protein
MTMASPVDTHKFNDDLLLAEQDRKLAARKYPTILHVLDHPELRQLFLEYDAPANRAKRNGRIAGFLAIAFGFIALAIAALEFPVMHQTSGRSPDLVRLALAISSAGCGIISVLIGSIGVLFARRKRQWLHNRLMGERIRQFHFQMLVFRLPDILMSLTDDAAKSAFLSKRKLWFDTFLARSVGRLDAVFVEMIREENAAEPWLHETRRQPAKIREGKELDALFGAYRELRILHQIGYANFKLQDDYRIFSAMPWRQAQVLSHISLISIVVLGVIDVGVLWEAFFPGSIWTAFAAGSINVITIWIALAALSVRAIEQGLQPEREVERYQQYRSSLRAVLDRFDRAQSGAEKIQVMEDMERLSFDELRNFLITNERARFVM